MPSPALPLLNLLLLPSPPISPFPKEEANVIVLLLLYTPLSFTLSLCYDTFMQKRTHARIFSIHTPSVCFCAGIFVFIVALLALIHPIILPFFFPQLITPSHQGNGKLDFDFYLWMAVPDTRAPSQDINSDKCAFFSDPLPSCKYYLPHFCVENLSSSEYFLKNLFGLFLT